ncbi:CGNR zinc finger domain-containing protein [Pseudonocardia eucalypti]|uniref:CGNR zinc finger domain-containing protein n=1 Tax=Pseudonocardia eucalypti TaxID=648755 RepID=A0ABP9Q3J5_9PSEU|nr:putative RNA-binding Zn ribbon-like protein [Pseudonocardia eucalypti]
MVTPWDEERLIGGHPVLDLTNTVFDRAHPAEDNELLKTPSDVLAWCASAGIGSAGIGSVGIGSVGIGSVGIGSARPPSVEEVRAVREQVWAVFNAMAHGEPVPAEPFGALLERAGTGVRAGQASPEGSIPAYLALLAVQARFTLPPERVRSCGRCGWLFLDSSRGGRRRWCSMSTCGNREKATRHRRVSASGASGA